MTNVYRLSPQAKTMTWSEWRKVKGCGLSQIAENEVKRSFGKPIFWQKDNATDPLFLGDIARASILADRELARFGKENLGFDNWAYLEYSNGVKIDGPMCDRSACGDYSSGPCDNDDCNARVDGKWSWKMDYCKKQGIPPANSSAWDQAETAWKLTHNSGVQARR